LIVNLAVSVGGRGVPRGPGTCAPQATQYVLASGISWEQDRHFMVSSRLPDVAKPDILLRVHFSLTNLSVAAATILGELKLLSGILRLA
jgi:hypothetical protein